MKDRFNLSLWVINHRELVWYLMGILIIIGSLSYTRLGRNEDPVFAIKTMLVQTKWPGATIDETMNQVTERIEKNSRKLLTSIISVALLPQVLLLFLLI